MYESVATSLNVSSECICGFAETCSVFSRHSVWAAARATAGLFHVLKLWCWSCCELMWNINVIDHRDLFVADTYRDCCLHFLSAHRVETNYAFLFFGSIALVNILKWTPPFWDTLSVCYHLGRALMTWPGDVICNKTPSETGQHTKAPHQYLIHIYSLSLLL